MTWRYSVLVTHRWIGLGTCVILAVTGITGSVIVWDADNLLRKVAGKFHESLALGEVGAWAVLLATGGAIILQLGGIVLWWRRKVWTVRTGAGWKRLLSDLHHVGGVLALLVMLTLAVTGLGLRLVAPEGHKDLRATLKNFHTSHTFAAPIKLLYSLGSAGFMIQGVTGVVMWWKPRKRRDGR